MNVFHFDLIIIIIKKLLLNKSIIIILLRQYRLFIRPFMSLFE